MLGPQSRREAPVQVGRTVETILAEWRARERELEAPDAGDRKLLEARIAALRDEHRMAVAARAAEAEALRRAEGIRTVPRGADPEKVYLARRSALFRNLTATGSLDGLEAGHRIAAWERSDDAAGLDRLTPAFWDAAARWLLEWTKRTITEDAS
jgi:hypothetical protein